MRALIVPDLHLDLWLPTGAAHPLGGIEREVLEALDLVVVAGDLVNKGQDRWGRALGWLGERVDLARVHLFPGNHDVYGGGGALDREDRLRDAAEAVGARWAQKAEVVLGGRRFLCCTLWTDMALGGGREANAHAAESLMNDHRMIRGAGGYRRARAADTVAVHCDHRCWLEARLAAPFDGDTVVVTHHAPLPACVGRASGPGPGPECGPDAGPGSGDGSLAAACGPVAAAYASDLSDLVERHRPTLWAYGHTHVPLDVTWGATRVLNVSVGYPPGADPRAPDQASAGLLEW